MSKGKPPEVDGAYEQPTRDGGGGYNRKNFLLGGAGVIAAGVLLYSVAGVTIEREKPIEEHERVPNFASAKIPDVPPEPAPEPEPEATVEPTQRSEQRTERRAEPRQKRRAQYKSVLAFGNKHMEPVMGSLLQRSSMSQERSGGVQTAGMAEGTGEPSARGGKQDFYTGGGGRSRQGLYHQHSLQPELDGCVVKAGEEMIIQNPNPVRTELPGQVRGLVTEDVYGRIFLGNGQIDECLAVPAGSRVMTEVNASGISRGDMRVQMCATRIDLVGGGIMPMDCSPTLGQDGAFGVEAESEYAWGGIMTGILVEAALSTVSSLGQIIQGPAGVAVQVGTRGVEGAGSDYVRRELMRPPVLTMKPGAIYRIQVQSDISFPE